MATTVTDPLIGRLIDGRYEVVARIARGGMATVYRARDRRLDREVALKLMHPHLAEGTDVAARFRREARAAARLAHPGVVQVFDQGSEGETSYLTMEYVEGTNLRRLLGRAGALSVGVALDVTIAILDALAAAHRAGFVHRDIKPENVLVATNAGAGGVGGIKVADFGLARAATEATAASTGTLLGTVAYLAPEIITDGRADARADVYAVGVLCYELLTGRQPFEGETAIQVAYQHVHEDLPVPSSQAPELPREVDEFVATLTARDPADRPAGAGAALDLALELRRRLDADSLAVRADVPGSDEGPADDATLALADGREGGGTIALPIGAVNPESAGAGPGDTAALPRRRRRWPVLVLLLLLLVAALGAGAWWYFEHGPGAYTTVPEVAGGDAASAASALELAGLRSETERAYSDDVARGRVITTDPSAGTRVLLDAEVTLVLSDGIRMIEMPELTGLDEEGIRSALAEAGWDGEAGALTLASDWSTEVEAGRYLSGGPDPGTSLRHDEALALTLSGGPAPVTIINVEGSSAEEARADLEDTGLVYVEAEEAEFSDDVPAGNVLSQEPAAGSEGHEGDEVTVVLSQGPELFEVPGVFGKRFEAAKEILEEAGFEVERSNALGGLLGLVQSQSVAAGEMKPRDTVIVLTVV
ncbi:Stk1 family PASTA domain-containing Ser/Thr kinase [Pseudactinotalea sp. HY158]|uniref:Stk1 family PASTA domain-containing Ser/Thr kinase n=1 Tax=Pseudactinotalea sp. HY158 TaxID=2654547 RepID=UPI00129CB698|nr:Stk1 family PASTA domain-containing Ser/Thr kinase [Pseudactinotalea sp. HY158]QGH69274.1 Stk1 family PASTA domain-containing Ser/Thr kinase [Pseudactinotalea sp. HY158]